MKLRLRKLKLTKAIKKNGGYYKESPDKMYTLLVNDRYEICYSDFVFRECASGRMLGQGASHFIHLIRDEHNKSSIEVDL